MIRYGNDVTDEVIEVVGLDCLRGAGFSISTHRHRSCLISGVREGIYLMTPRIPALGKAVTHHHCGPLSFGDVMDVYSIALNDVFLQIAGHLMSLSPLASVLAI